MNNVTNGIAAIMTINVSDGNYIETNGIVVGARGFSVDGGGSDHVSITNNVDSESKTWWMFLVSGGSLQLQNLRLY
jgi:hypothetical protein